MRSKEKFLKIDENHIIHCDICENDYPKIKYTMKNIKENCNNGICIYCDWMKRHENKLPVIDGWTEEEIDIAIKFILMGESLYLNDLLEKYESKKHSLKDICILSKELHIGNKHYMVRVKCENCGKDVEVHPSVFLKNKNIYCSNECYWSDKTYKIEKGRESKFYSSIDTFCTNCKKPISVIPYDYNKRNRFGDNFNFCSHECYWEFRSKYYVGKKSTMYHYKFSEKQLEKIRMNLLKNSRKSSRLESNIQIITNNILSELNIKFEREKIIKYYAVDNYLYENNGLIIEVMGDYWHANPNRYNADKYALNKHQLRGILKDKQKHSYILNHNNVEILYLWEHDILNNIELCKNLIVKYLETNGKLENYHSFNYYINSNNLLCLKEKIIIPYQNMSSNDYKHLAKDK